MRVVDFLCVSVGSAYPFSIVFYRSSKPFLVLFLVVFNRRGVMPRLSGIEYPSRVLSVLVDISFKLVRVRSVFLRDVSLPRVSCHLNIDVDILCQSRCDVLLVAYDELVHRAIPSERLRNLEEGVPRVFHLSDVGIDHIQVFRELSLVELRIDNQSLVAVEPESVDLVGVPIKLFDYVSKLLHGMVSAVFEIIERPFEYVCWNAMFLSEILDYLLRAVCRSGIVNYDKVYYSFCAF